MLQNLFTTLRMGATEKEEVLLLISPCPTYFSLTHEYTACVHVPVLPVSKLLLSKAWYRLRGCRAQLFLRGKLVRLFMS
jgi:hypothetical protein